ncbi:trypsin-like peptidase domain-containing protein [Patescibacteria group bacterium]|nr:trypsin-like peptidase domain-containing protein [Patescibacteria group bacterium]
MPTKKLGLFLTGLTFGVLLTGVFFLGGFLDRLGFLKIIDRWLPFSGFGPEQGYLEQKVLREESVIIDIAEKAAASAVTVSINKTERVPLFDFDPFGFFNFQTQERKIEQDIGSGFIVDGGLVVTNKHVVSDTSAKYKVIDKDDHILEVKDIYRDPANDLAILKVETQLPALELGNSEDLKVGQLVIAIGTALGKFRHTVTTGVISGLGRGITAGSAFEGYAEQLDNVIQTDAAINPGNSGGPLLDSSGKVIGVNVAIAGGAQNIGFAIPIDVVRESLKLFKETGEFNRPFFGVEYQMISEKAAILNEVPQGAYIRRVVSGSAAEEAGLKEGDIVTYIDGERLEGDESNLVKIVNRKKVGDKVEIKYWRDGQTVSVTVRLTTKNEG